MPSLAFLFRNDTWQSGQVFLWVIWSEKTHSLLETTEREREKGKESEQERGGEEGTMGSGKGQETNKD